MREENGVNVFECAGADVVGLGAEQLFGDAWPDLECAFHVVLLHDVFYGEGGGDLEGDAGVMAFTVAGGSGDDGIVIGDTGLLRGLRDAVDVGAECDDGLALAPGGHEGGGDSGDAALDLEAVFLEDVGEVFGGVGLVVAELGVAEDCVDHDLDLLGAGVDAGDSLLLHGGEGGGVSGSLGGGGEGQD